MKVRMMRCLLSLVLTLTLAMQGVALASATPHQNDCPQAMQSGHQHDSHRHAPISAMDCEPEHGVLCCSMMAGHCAFGCMFLSSVWVPSDGRTDGTNPRFSDDLQRSGRAMGADPPPPRA